MEADEGQIIAQALDIDGDGVAINPNETDIALYFVNLAGFPNASYDPVNNTIYLGYSGYLESTSSGSQSYRHVYLMYSDDNGCTWTEPTDVTPNSSFAECVFPSFTQITTDSVRLIYQEDFEPGLAVRGDEDGYVSNEIVYIARDKSELASNSRSLHYRYYRSNGSVYWGLCSYYSHLWNGIPMEYRTNHTIHHDW
jgi:hypothetical protein